MKICVVNRDSDLFVRLVDIKKKDSALYIPNNGIAGYRSVAIIDGKEELIGKIVLVREMDITRIHVPVLGSMAFVKENKVFALLDVDRETEAVYDIDEMDKDSKYKNFNAYGDDAEWNAYLGQQKKSLFFIESLGRKKDV